MRRLICILISLALITVSMSGCSVQTDKDVVSEDYQVQEVEKSETRDYKAVVAKKMSDLYKFLGENNYFSGYILVGTQDELVYAGGCGYADYEKKLEFNEYTKFKVASISKQIIATSIMQLMEKGKLDVNDKLEKYIPEFPHSEKITLHHLLTHSSGLETDAPDYDLRHYIPGEDKKLATGPKRPMDLGLMFNPGEGFNYSNVGYQLLSFIIEKVSEQDVGEYFKENIFDPLEMKNTGFVTPGVGMNNFAVGYLNGEQTVASPDLFLFKVGQEGKGGFYSCAEDLYKWNLALHSGKILKPETQDIMWTRYNENYGYGWYIYGDSPNPVNYVHDGHTNGFSSKLIKTSEGISIVILSNYDEIDLSYILDCVISILVDEENNEPTS